MKHTLPAALIALGVALAGYLVGQAFVDARSLDRTVVVKGLAEQEVSADRVIWPIQFIVADNDLATLLDTVETQTEHVLRFVSEQGFVTDEISVGAPAIVDKQAQGYGDPDTRFRYNATRVITVYSEKIEQVRSGSTALIDLGKAGLVINGNKYENPTQYLFNGLNDIKPGMIEEATRNAREVAQKFAADSASTLGKIKSARQGQFSIEDRDSNNPHIKKVRIVSTLEYYLVD